MNDSVFTFASTLPTGGLVSSRSVKLVERISNQEEPEGRNAWWTEIRMEVRSHARALACNVVLGYKEEISIWSVHSALRRLLIGYS